MKKLWKEHRDMFASAAIGFVAMSALMFVETLTTAFLPWNLCFRAQTRDRGHKRPEAGRD